MEMGTVVQIIGTSVDIRFESEKLPKLLNAIKIEDQERKINLTLEVAQHLGDNVVRCIALASTDGLVRGMKALDTGAPISVPVGDQTLGRIFNVFGDARDEKGPLQDEKKRYPIHRRAPLFEELLPVTSVFET